MPLKEKFDRFASRNFHRQCVFSRAISDGSAHCANALKNSDRSYHCRSSNDQISCVMAVDAALVASEFALSKCMENALARHRIVELGLLHTMRDALAPGVHPNLPITNITRLVAQVLGPTSGEIPGNLQQRLVRRIAKRIYGPD